MTKEESDAAIGRAFRESKELERQIACPRMRIKENANAALTLVDNRHHAESRKVMAAATDIREDLDALDSAEDRRAELKEILR